MPVPVGVGTGIKPGAGASGNGVAVPNPAAVIPQPATNAMQEVNGAVTTTAASADTSVVAVAQPEPQGRV